MNVVMIWDADYSLPACGGTPTTATSNFRSTTSSTRGNITHADRRLVVVCKILQGWKLLGSTFARNNAPVNSHQSE